MVATEDLELWFQDPVEIVQNLIGNPTVKEHMTYTPEKVYQDKKDNVRIFDEMCVRVTSIGNRAYCSCQVC